LSSILLVVVGVAAFLILLPSNAWITLLQMGLLLVMTTWAMVTQPSRCFGGERTLFFSTDPAHSTGDVLDLPLGEEPRPVLPNLWAMEIDPEAETDRYIRDVKGRVREVTSPRLLQEVEREIDVARVSPGAEEAAVFDRFAELMRLAGTEYDRVVFDTAPTGHTLRLLSLPELLTVWIEGLVGRRRKVNALGRTWRNVAGAAASATRGPIPCSRSWSGAATASAARAIVTDCERTAFAFVLVPERLPILETRKAVTALDRYGIPVGAVIVNRVLQPESEGVFLQRRRAREAAYRDEIRSTFGTHPLQYLPLFETYIHGISALRRVIEAISD
jgi:arsenite/tail-anchored protein-transporting ATPase